MRRIALAVLALGADCVGLQGGGDWAVSDHGCGGNRTDAVWFDDSFVGFVGCGTTAEGTGLYRTRDGGRTWDPVAGFEDFRVGSLSRTADGPLLVGGIEVGGDERVRALADDGRIDPVFVAGTASWSRFQVGTYRERPDGFAVAESLTGVDVVYRTGADEDFSDGYGWWGEGESVQILDLEVLGDGFIGVGSTITQPPFVFVPPPDPTPAFSLVPIALDDGISGELWSVDTDGTTVVAGGVDQGRDVGLLAIAAVGALSSPEDWTLLSLDAWFEDATWVRGVCVDGDRLVAVGERPLVGDGFVLWSDDRGATFVDRTPFGAPPLSQCVVRDDGAVVVVGAEGFVAVR